MVNSSQLIWIGDNTDFGGLGLRYPSYNRFAVKKICFFALIVVSLMFRFNQHFREKKKERSKCHAFVVFAVNARWRVTRLVNLSGTQSGVGFPIFKGFGFKRRQVRGEFVFAQNVWRVERSAKLYQECLPLYSISHLERIPTISSNWDCHRLDLGHAGDVLHAF